MDRRSSMPFKDSTELSLYSRERGALGQTLSSSTNGSVDSKRPVRGLTTQQENCFQGEAQTLQVRPHCLEQLHSHPVLISELSVFRHIVLRHD